MNCHVPVPPLVYRLVKSSPLTALEGDTNLQTLVNAINGLEARMNVSLLANGQLANNAVTLASIPDGIITAAKFDASILPIGIILGLSSGTIPSGWLECKGQAIPRGSYGAALFALIGTTYGIGDGATTFNLPDLQGRCPIGEGSGAGLTTRSRGDKVGEETHLLDLTEIPAHTHTIAKDSNGVAGAGGWRPSDNPASTNTGSAGGGNAHNNMDPSLCLTFIIRVT